MTSKQVKVKTLKHYDRMIAWAEKQKPRKFPSNYEMRDAIRETWFATDCPHCQKHNIGGACCECPLQSEDTQCCSNLWSKMSNSLTWKTWIKYAKQVRQYIEENG